MKKIKTISFLTVLFIMLFSFSIIAMGKDDIINGDFVRPTPLNESESSGQKWTWISDNSCVRFSAYEYVSMAGLQRKYNYGGLPQWAEGGNKEETTIKQRDTYSGKWSQSTDGIWSFEFDDKTIPVGVTKIDGVLYAFTGYGELKADYEYYEGLKTAADGLVTSDNPDFLSWLGTQYLPECTSHE